MNSIIALSQTSEVREKIKPHRLTAPLPRFLTYPARPMNGGQLEHAAPCIGRWFNEPKYNGWRALVHAPSRAIWNRHGELLSIAAEFAPALEILAASPFEWLDCEALERRHGFGRGTLIVLDLPESTAPYEERSHHLRATFPKLLGKVEPNAVYSVPVFPEPTALYAALKVENRDTFDGTEFYEGIVRKKADSLYPRQTLKPDRATPHWIKHRWKF